MSSPCSISIAIQQPGPHHRFTRLSGSSGKGRSRASASVWPVPELSHGLPSMTSPAS